MTGATRRELSAALTRLTARRSEEWAEYKRLAAEDDPSDEPRHANQATEAARCKAISTYLDMLALRNASAALHRLANS